MNHLLKIRAATIVLVVATAAVFPAGRMGIVFETGRSDVFFPLGKSSMQMKSAPWEFVFH